MNRTKVVIGAILAVVVAILVYCQAYYLRNEPGATLFYKGDEAYLFLGTSRTGYHFSYLALPFVFLKEYLNAPPFPADRRISMDVLFMNTSGIQRHKVEFGDNPGNAPEFLTPFDDGFYAICQGVVLCKLDGDHFDRVTNAEEAQYHSINRLSRGFKDGQVINGWCVRKLGRPPDNHFEANIASDFVISGTNLATQAGQYPWLEIRLQRAGQAINTIYDVDGTPRKISKAGYDGAFPQR